jgi:DNA-binding NarL/FixJ family response regulator
VSFTFVVNVADPILERQEQVDDIDLMLVISQVREQRDLQAHRRSGQRCMPNLRQLGVLSGVAAGLTNEEIAIQLHLTPRMVERNRVDLRDILGANDTAFVTRYAAGHNLLEPLEPVGVITERQQYLVTAIASSLLNKEIADMFGLSLNTVHNHRADVAKCLGCSRTAFLTRYALSKGWVDLIRPDHPVPPDSLAVDARSAAWRCL